MGSSGTGSFGNYKPDNMKKDKNARQGLGVNGVVSGGEIECPLEIKMIRLEDVQLSEYYKQHGTVPPMGAAVLLSKKLHHGRIVVIATNTNEIIGNLPTQYNYLINCLNIGKSYSGNVINSDLKPVPFVVVSLHA